MRVLMIEIKRTYKDNCTCGELLVSDDQTGQVLLEGIRTLELPYLDNKPSVSCIGEGFYIVKPYSSKKFKDALKIYSVAESRENRHLLLNDYIFREKWLRERIDSNKNLVEAKGRSAILIHRGNSVANFTEEGGGNWKQESTGCILVGATEREATSVKDTKYNLVLNSRQAMTRILEVVKKEGIGCLFIYNVNKGLYSIVNFLRGRNV